MLNIAAEGLLARREVFATQAEVQHVVNVLYSMGKLAYCHVELLDFLTGELLARKTQMSVSHVLNVLHTCEVQWCGKYGGGGKQVLHI